MAFIGLFVIMAFTIPLLGEIHQRGKDNILFRSGKEIVTSSIYISTVSKLGMSVNKIGSFATSLLSVSIGAAVIVVAIISLTAITSLALPVLGWIMLLIAAIRQIF